MRSHKIIFVLIFSLLLFLISNLKSGSIEKPFTIIGTISLNGKKLSNDTLYLVEKYNERKPTKLDMYHLLTDKNGNYEIILQCVSYCLTPRFGSHFCKTDSMNQRELSAMQSQIPDSIQFWYKRKAITVKSPHLEVYKYYYCQQSQNLFITTINIDFSTK